MERVPIRTLQAPLKELYRDDPAQAVADLTARTTVDISTLTCRVLRSPGDDRHLVAGLHPKAGGSTDVTCSGDLLMQALATCAGVTLAAVATAMELDLASAEVEAIGRMDFRGTLGVSREVPVGITSITINFYFPPDAVPDKTEKLIQLVERYCVVLQTLRNSATVSSHCIIG